MLFLREVPFDERVEVEHEKCLSDRKDKGFYHRRWSEIYKCRQEQTYAQSGLRKQRHIFIYAYKHI